MEEEITLEHEGKSYLASYILLGDELTVYLPDGSQRSTTLRGLLPEHAAMPHLRSYVFGLASNRRPK